MDANALIISKLLQDVRPTGFSAGQTIKYGVLTAGFMEARVMPKASDFPPLKETDPRFISAMATWKQENGKDFSAVSPGQMEQIAKALAAWATVLDVKFERDDSNAQIRFGVGDLTEVKSDDGVNPAGGYNSREHNKNTQTDYNVIIMPKSSDEDANGVEWAPGDKYFVALMHEIGHALGLAHPGTYTLGQEAYAGKEDNRIDTIMSYRRDRPDGYTDDRTGYGSVLQSPFATMVTLTPARYDIAALQKLLGSNQATKSSCNEFKFVDAVRASEMEFRTIFDAGGQNDGDVINAAACVRDVRINLEPGTASAIGTISSTTRNIVIAFNTWIEDAIGGRGNDYLVGNELANSLTGGLGADNLEGGQGNDTLLGGEGIDILSGGAGADTYSIDSGKGTDLIRDGDGQGVLKFGERLIQGKTGVSDPEKWRKLDDNTWLDQEAGIIYGQLTANGKTRLIVHDGTRKALIDNWAVGQLGIDASGGSSSQPLPVVSLTLSGDHPAIDYGEAVGIQVLYDGLGNLRTDYGQTQARQDVLYGTIGNDRLLGQSGTDYLDGKGGHDSLEGGIGADALAGGQGDDQLNGGDGADILLGDHTLEWFYSYEKTKNSTLVANINQQVSGLDTTYTWYISTASSASPAIGGNDVIRGGAGNDFVNAGGGDDLVEGEGDDDALYGDGGKDRLYGGLGNDALVGDGYGSGAPFGDDYLSGGDGNDKLYGTGGNDYLDGGVGNDILMGDGNGTTDDGDDVILGGLGQDKLYGGGGADILLGGEEVDELRGEGGNDLLEGGSGADYLAGGEGDDVYLGVEGIDIVDDDEGNNTIYLADAKGLGAAGVSNSLFTSGDGTGYQVDVALDTGSVLHLWNAFYSNGTTTLHFANGGGMVDVESLISESMTTPVALARTLNGGRVFGGAGSDTLSGSAWNDEIVGYKGDDALYGGLGDDIYLYRLGDGKDIIVETGGSDVLRLGEGIAPGNVKLIRSWLAVGDDALTLEIRSADGNLQGQVHLAGYFLTEGNRIERIEFSEGTAWTYADIQAHFLRPSAKADELKGFLEAEVIDGAGGDDRINGQAGDDTLYGGAGMDDIKGGDGADKLLGGDGDDRLMGGDGSINDGSNDTLDGGVGNDLLYGGAGDDVYLFGRGYGFDHIGEMASPSGPSNDVLRLKAGVLPQHVSLHRVANDLYVAIDAGNTQIRVANQFVSGDKGIERIEFDNGGGGAWALADILSRVQVGTPNSLSGTAGNDIFSVDHEGDAVTEAANSGVDKVMASRPFTLPANVENLTLTGFLNIGGTGNALDNVLYGNVGDNTLNGAGGNDVAYGGKGNDVYLDIEEIVEYAGEGIDTLVRQGGGALPANVENLFMGSYGREWAIPGYDSFRFVWGGGAGTAIGNELDNILTSPGNGYYGAILDGKGGADTMVINGLDGVTVYVDNPGDRIVVAGGKGPTEIRSSVSYTLEEPTRFLSDNAYNASSVGNRLILIGDGAISAVGNPVANWLAGNENAAANVLAGGAGDDTYMLGLNDSVVELPGEGQDIAYLWGEVSDREFRLADLGLDNVEEVGLVARGENLALRGDVQDNVLSVNRDLSWDAVRIFGEAGNDSLTGGNLADVLDGGTGNDIMEGGRGGDTYIVDSVADEVLEYDWNEWSPVPDTVESSVDFTLGAYVENLTLTGTNAINGNGNSLGNFLTGNAANNILSGGDGGDTYHFSYGAGQDTIVDASGWDSLRMDGVHAANVALSRVGNDLVLALSSGNDRVTVRDHFLGDQHKIEEAVFEDAFLQGYELDNLTRSRAPIMLGSIPDFAVAAGAEWTYSLPEGMVVDPDAGDYLSFSANEESQDSLPYWLTFDPETRTFSGTPGDDSVGAVKITISATDRSSLSVSDTFEIKVIVPGQTVVGGVGNDTLLGGAGNDTLDGGAGADRLLGGSGDDTYVVDNIGDVITEYTAQGVDSVRSSVTLTLPSNVEKLTLTGFSTINGTGNALNNVLSGNSAANTLSGGSGADTLIGGAGNDTYVVDNIGDVVNEVAGEGVDLVQSSVTHTLAANIENLSLSGSSFINGTGNAINNVLTGNSANNSLNGGDGNDTIDGGAGIDTLIGGLGNDTYVIDTLSDVVTENANEGTDTVQSGLTYTLGGNLENLILTGTSAINGTGNALNNLLTGNAANNTLVGGLGSDTLNGGAGNDIIEGDPTNASAIQAVNSLVVYAKGIAAENIFPSMEIWLDGVKMQTVTVSSTSFAAYNIALPTGTLAKEVAVVFTNDYYNANTKQDRNLYVDQIVVNGQLIKSNAPGVIKDFGVGSQAFDAINTYAGNSDLSSNSALHFGLAGGDLLDGGSGVDTLRGGIGNDIYVVDNTADVIEELANAGHDIVRSAVSYTLSANLEDLNLQGSANLNGTGNAGQNMLVGNTGANRLDGGLARDFMVGGAGDDSFVVDNTGDATWEVANGGMDSVESSISWTLQSHTEILTLTGTSVINGTGNAEANLIRGNAAINAMNGGAGNDILEGGLGDDILIDTSGAALFNGGAGADKITGGAGAEIYLGGLGNDTLTTGAGNDIILFNKGDGQDTFAAGGAGSDTLALGGGLSYGDLNFAKASNDLVLKVGAADQITFKDWYAATPSKPVAKLQVMAEAMAGFVQGGSDALKNQKVENFNFAGLVGAFDAARSANSGLTSWALTNALSSFQLAGSDTAAMGGDLAYQYGRNGTLAGIGVTPALSTLSDANLGINPQALNTLASLQTGSARLS